MSEYSEFVRQSKYKFLAPYADKALPHGHDKIKLIWAKSTATQAYDAKNGQARKLFDVRAPCGERPADTRKRAIQVMTNFILNSGTDFYDWLGENADLNIGWVDDTGHSLGLRNLNGNKPAAVAMENWRQRHDEGTHEVNDRIAERLQRLSQVEVKRTQLIAARITRK